MKGVLDSLILIETAMILQSTQKRIDSKQYPQIEKTCNSLEYHFKNLVTTNPNIYSTRVERALKKFYRLSKQSPNYRSDLYSGLSAIMDEFSNLPSRDPKTNGYYDLGEFCRILSKQVDDLTERNKKARLKE